MRQRLTLGVMLALMVGGSGAAVRSTAQIEPPIQRALRQVPPEALHVQAEGYLPVLDRFYAARQYRPLWTDVSGLTANGRRLLAAVQSADLEGLEPDQYLAGVNEAVSAGAASTADLEVLVTVAALRYAHDLGWGVTLPAAVDRANSYEARTFDAADMLARLASAGDPGAELRAVAPASLAYSFLREGLARLRAIRDRGGWTTASAGPTLRPGDRGPRVEELRRLLIERGDLAETAADGDAYDDRVTEALRRFQQRHGLEPDGIYGSASRAAFNVPLSTRIQQLRLALERIRWLPPTFAGRRIGVNLADFKVYVLDDQDVTLEMRAVIGRQYFETPMFSALMTYVVINPYWNVPPSIARAEILPEVARDPEYLARNHMELTNGVVRQLPGPWNALGSFKFMFPNVHNVYLHDTPARALFDQAARTFSHGCIRVELAAEMAAVLLGPQGWTPARIADTVRTGAQTVVTLAQPIPVHISYATAFLDPQGTLHFRPDVYGRDRRLVAALEQRGHGAWER